MMNLAGMEIIKSTSETILNHLTELLFNGPAEIAERAEINSHAETQRAQSFIRPRIVRIERIDSIFGVHERCLQRCTDH